MRCGVKGTTPDGHTEHSAARRHHNLLTPVEQKTRPELLNHYTHNRVSTFGGSPSAPASGEYRIESCHSAYVFASCGDVLRDRRTLSALVTPECPKNWILDFRSIGVGPVTPVALPPSKSYRRTRTDRIGSATNPRRSANFETIPNSG